MSINGLVQLKGANAVVDYFLSPCRSLNTPPEEVFRFFGSVQKSAPDTGMRDDIVMTLAESLSHELPSMLVVIPRSLSDSPVDSHENEIRYFSMGQKPSSGETPRTQDCVSVSQVVRSSRSI